MKSLIHPFAQLPSWLVILAGILWIIYKAIYKDLNPTNLQLEDAVIQVVLILMGLIGGIHYAIAHIQQRTIDGSATMRMTDAHNQSRISGTPAARPPYGPRDDT